MDDMDRAGRRRMQPRTVDVVDRVEPVRVERGGRDGVIGDRETRCNLRQVVDRIRVRVERGVR